MDQENYRDEYFDDGPRMPYVDTAPYQDFARKRLGFEFHDIWLLITALTHRSYVNEHRNSPEEHNERLEFLGDAVLELVTSDFLFKNFDLPEGEMTAIRAKLVRTESICNAGKKLGYVPLVRLSHGEMVRGLERAHDSIYADCFEAVTGAIYVDQGWETARNFIAKHILCMVDDIIHEETWRDPKSHLQELTQKIDMKTPSYRTLREEGPDHDKWYTVAVYVDGELKGIGQGHSKQDAQEIAARKVIKIYKELEARLEAEGIVNEPGADFGDDFDDGH